jgi:hypothetical protein
MATQIALMAEVLIAQWKLVGLDLGAVQLLQTHALRFEETEFSLAQTKASEMTAIY